MDWEERFVSHERGFRVVHYLLRDREGTPWLAVVGTERSLRHMVYVVRDEFLPIAGLDKSTTSGYKWRARREVVDWLSSLIIKSRFSDANHSAGIKHAHAIDLVPNMCTVRPEVLLILLYRCLISPTTCRCFHNP